ncbi:hypothetical protein V6Z11_A06G142500 [Gossypium hirsutum]
MVEDINMLLERLNFSEEESIRFFSLNMSSTNVKGYEAWAVAPRGVVDYMQSNICRMWWSSKKSGRFWAMLLWEKVYHPKGMGGLGF